MSKTYSAREKAAFYEAKGMTFAQHGVTGNQRFGKSSDAIKASAVNGHQAAIKRIKKHNAKKKSR